MWPDLYENGKADYRATYIFKEGRPHQISKIAVSQE